MGQVVAIIIDNTCDFPRRVVWVMNSKDCSLESGGKLAYVLVPQSADRGAVHIGNWVRNQTFLYEDLFLFILFERKYCLFYFLVKQNKCR